MGLLLIFRYTGVFDWDSLYRDSKTFFEKKIPSGLYFTETKHQHKKSKIDISWTIHHNYDAYHQLEYKIQFKIIKPKTVMVDVDGEQKAMIEGPMRVWIGFQLNNNYDEDSPAGPRILLPKGSWLEKIYYKMTWRDRWDLAEDIGVFVSHDYLEFLKQKTNMYAKGYASIWEPG